MPVNSDTVNDQKIADNPQVNIYGPADESEVRQKRSGHLGRKLVILLLIAGIISGLIYGGKRSLPWLIQQKDLLFEAPKTNSTTYSSSVEIQVDQNGFRPATLLIKRGTRVRWVSQDSSSHQVITDPHPIHNQLPSLKSSKLFEMGIEFTYKFDNVGTFTYHDENNPLKAKGTIIVE